METTFTLFLILPAPIKLLLLSAGGFAWCGIAQPMPAPQAQAVPQVVPAVPAVPAKRAAQAPVVVVPIEKVSPVAGEIIINVRVSGEVVVDGDVMTQKQLSAKLSRIAAVHKNQAIRIRGDGKVEYQRIVEVIDVCQKAGIPNISFATQVQRKKK